MANTTGKKYGGRMKGTPNKLTKEIRTLLKDILYEEVTELHKNFRCLDEKDRIELLIKLLPFVSPKVSNVSHTINEPLDWDV